MSAIAKSMNSCVQTTLKQFKDSEVTVFPSSHEIGMQTTIIGFTDLWLFENKNSKSKQDL